MSDVLGQPDPARRAQALEILARETHDVLVVGGGITGAAIARGRDQRDAGRAQPYCSIRTFISSPSERSR